MKVSCKLTWACLLACAGMAGLGAAWAAAEATSPDANPYSVITNRNVFRLVDPPPPPPAEPPKEVDEQKVMLTGFVGKGASEKVLMEIPSKDPKTPNIYLSLAPGEADHQVELVSIDLKREEVQIINAGTRETLSVKSNSFASAPPPAAHAPGGPPGMQMMPGGFRRQIPGVMPMNLRPPPAPSAAATPSGGSTVIAGGGGGSSTIIVGGGGGDSGGGTSSPMGSIFSSLANGSSSGQVSVSGGSPFAAASVAAPGNNVGNQIANGLFNQQTGQYRMPAPSGPPAPPEVQATGMLLLKTAMNGGGPPLPPPLAEMLQGNEATPPPVP